MYHIISKEVENHSLDTYAFLDTHVWINNPYWQVVEFQYFCASIT